MKQGSSWTARLAAAVLLATLAVSGCGAPCVTHVRSDRCAGTWR